MRDNVDYKNKICSHCGTKLSAFIKSGFLGCSYCYISFEKEISDTLLSAQYKCVNKGKRCDGTLFDKDLLTAQLKQMREIAADETRYADAEILNAQLKKLDGVAE